MTQPPESDPVQTFQPLTFQPILAPPELAVYQAQVRIQTAPDAPEYVVTATTSAPGDDTQKAALEDLLNKITVAFLLLTGPIPVDSGDIPADSGGVAPEQDDPNTQIIFEHRIEFARPGPGLTGIAATIKAATGPLPNETRDVVDPYHKDHVWKSRGGPQQATVHIDEGRGTIQPPLQTVVAGGGDKHKRYYAFGTRVTVHGHVRMIYDLDGNFIPPDPRAHGPAARSRRNHRPI